MVEKRRQRKQKEARAEARAARMNRRNYGSEEKFRKVVSKKLKSSSLTRNIILWGNDDGEQTQISWERKYDGDFVGLG